MSAFSKMTKNILAVVRLVSEKSLTEIFNGVYLESLRIIAQTRTLHIASGKLVLPLLNIVATEKCTLKCKYCANMMQYFIHPQHIELSHVLRDIDAFMSRVDFTREIDVLGGEPFIYKNLSEVLLHLLKYKKKYGFVRVTTNGTIVPSSETIETLKKARVFVRISNYGELSVKKESLTALLKKNGIPYYAGFSSWYACQQLVDGTDRTWGQIQELSRKCKINCNQLIHGKLYRCPLLAHGDTLRAYPYDEANFVDMSNPLTTKETIRQYLESFTPGCRFCSGGHKGLPPVPVAEQAGLPIPYNRYS